MDHSRLLGREWLMLLAVVGGAGAALFGSGQRSASIAAEPASPKPTGALLAPQTADIGVPPLPSDEPWMGSYDGSEPEEGETISGEVLEQIDVGQYSYLRLGEKGSAGIWTAVSGSPSRLGKRTTVSGAQLMTHFTSSTLKRTFPSIYFGVVVDQSATATPVEGHPPHAGGGVDATSVTKVERARGALGYTVAELNGPAASAGKKVRVRGIVVKSTSGVLGRTFLHVRDGSGDAQAGNHDLVVTTSAEVPVRSEVELEGTLEIDRDFGAGYRYRVLLSDAAVVPADSR